MKKNILFIFLLVILNLISFVVLRSQEKNPNKKIDWARLIDNWNTYISNPTEQNAIKVSGDLPENGHISKSDKDLKVVNEIFRNLTVIENSIKSNSKESYKLAFRLFTISDGAFTESLEIIIGDEIKNKPELFLNELEKNMELVNTNHILTNLDFRIYYSREKQILEIEKRINALNSISNKKLYHLKDLCLSELKIYKKSLQKEQGNH